MPRPRRECVVMGGLSWDRPGAARCGFQDTSGGRAPLFSAGRSQAEADPYALLVAVEDLIRPQLEGEIVHLSRINLENAVDRGLEAGLGRDARAELIALVPDVPAEQ